MEFDEFDRRLLDLVQRDVRRTNTDLAQAVNLSEAAVRRRLDRLRKSGIIKAEVALLDRDSVGVTLVVTITFKDESVEAYDAFEARMRSQDWVSQCYSIAGPKDFIAIVRAPSLPEYEDWGRAVIMSDPAILRYETAVVYSTVKFDTRIPV